MYYIKLNALTLLLFICITSGLEFRYGVKFAEILSLNYIIGTVGLWITAHCIAMGVLK